MTGNRRPGISNRSKLALTQVLLSENQGPRISKNGGKADIFGSNISHNCNADASIRTPFYAECGTSLGAGSNAPHPG